MELNEFFNRFNVCLNEQQKAAVESVEGPVLLLAVPGSGKTTVLVSRLGYMIHAKGIAPEKILTVTYTVAATADMKQRFAGKFGEEFAGRMEFRTINGISQKILQYFGRITGKEPFKVADKETSVIIKNVFREIKGTFATENDIKDIQTAITYVKNMRIPMEKLKNFDEDLADFSRIYVRYNQELKRMKMIDYDDQMVYALMLLERYPQVLEHFWNEYEYICVDEAQDTSKIQHDMINLLAKKSNNLFMVGDEDQSIYGFRAAYPQALVDFEKIHPNAKVLLMESNYRSNAEIVEAADKLIQRNKNRHDKHMRSTRPYGGVLKLIPVKTRKHQLLYLAKVAENCNVQTAVLYRNNESALPIIDMLDRRGISYRVKNSDMTFFSAPVVSDICDFLRLAINPYDGDIFLRIYYKMGAGISKTFATEVVDNNRRKKPLIEMVSDIKEMSPYVRGKCRAMATHFRNMREDTAGRAIFRILKHMGYEEYMDEHGMDAGKVKILKMLADQEDTIEGFLDRLNELQDIVTNGNGDYSSKFILSTIHSSKGLEYDRVFMIDMIEGILPLVGEPKGKNASTADIAGFEEERRLYYVGMTRAKDELNIFSFEHEDTSTFTKNVFLQEKAKASVKVKKDISAYHV